VTAADSPLVAVLVRRGDRVESRHRVAYAIVDVGGRIHAAAGDPAQPVFPRSAVKPLQALALVESGAAERFGVGAAELALASASHGGEPMHVDAVRRWLARLGLDESALECGIHPPSHRPSADQLARAGQAPGPVHNNCSGKHAGMITLALHQEVPIEGYVRPDHPVQQRITQALANMAGLAQLPPPEIDGCGMPTFAIPLRSLALAMARLGAPSELAPPRTAACDRIRSSMSAHPEMVAGSGRTVTAILEVVPDIVVKSGAEGVYTAALPRHGLGLALKVEDGAERAAEVAALALLDALGVIDARARSRLERFARPTLVNHGGTPVGRIEPAPGWPSLPDELRRA
jgi:L-asparaginase II